MKSDEQDLADRVFLGAEVERFLATPIGIRMLEHVESQRNDAVNAFSRVDITDAGALSRIQMQLKMADQFQQWLADALSEAAEAVRVIEGSSFTD